MRYAVAGDELLVKAAISVGEKSKLLVLNGYIFRARCLIIFRVLDRGSVIVLYLYCGAYSYKFFYTITASLLKLQSYRCRK